MKRFFRDSLSVALTIAIATLLGTSCKKGDVVAEIPGCIEIICEVGDRPTIPFTAGSSWQLSSDATWCKFIQPSGEVQDIKGNAGSHTITLQITDEGIKSQPTFANITMKMNGKKGIIATVERGADKLYMRFTDITDTPIQSIKAGYIDWVEFRINANFRFAAIEKPEWIEFGVRDESQNIIVPTTSITGVPGEQLEAYARIIPDGERERYAITAEDGYVITFSNDNGSFTLDYPVTFDGMGNDQLSFTGPTDQCYNWEVSLDGKQFRQTDSTTGTVSQFQNSLDFYITALNDNYTVLRFEKKIDRGISSYVCYKEDDSSWINFKQDPSDFSTLTISVDPTENTRHGMVMVLPIAVWNKIRANIIGNLFEADASSGIELPTLIYDYQQYVIFEFAQHDLSDVDQYEGMYIYHSLTTLEIPATAFTSSSTLEKYNVETAYTCPFVNSIADKKPGIVIDPRIEGWTTELHESGNATAEVWYKDELLKISDDEYYIGENKDERLSLFLWGPKSDFTENVYIVFKTNGTPRKLLVVTPPAH